MGYGLLGHVVGYGQLGHVRGGQGGGDGRGRTRGYSSRANTAMGPWPNASHLGPIPQRVPGIDDLDDHVAPLQHSPQLPPHLQVLRRRVLASDGAFGRGEGGGAAANKVSVFEVETGGHEPSRRV